MSSNLAEQRKKLRATQDELNAVTETAMDAVRRGDEL